VLDPSRPTVQGTSSALEKIATAESLQIENNIRQHPLRIDEIFRAVGTVCPK
jgi:hypothetical protein